MPWIPTVVVPLGARLGRDATVPQMATDTTGAYESIMGLRKGGKAVILVTYRGDW